MSEKRKDYKHYNKASANKVPSEAKENAGSVVSNFKTAWNQLFEVPADEDDNQSLFLGKNVVNEPQVPKKVNVVEEIKEPKPRTFSFSSPPPEPVASSILSEKTVIARGAEINGDIKTKGDVDIQGIVNGAVISTGKVCINGTVNGNLEAESVTIDGGKFHGQTVTAMKSVTILSHSKVAADITAGSFDLDSAFTGNITVSNSITLRSGAILNGNIIGKSISVQDGAVISGTCKISHTL